MYQFLKTRNSKNPFDSVIEGSESEERLEPEESLKSESEMNPFDDY